MLATMRAAASSRSPRPVVQRNGGASSLLLLGCQQQLSDLLQPTFESAGDQAEHARKLDLHRNLGVEHVDDTGHGLAHRRDAEGQSVHVPAFAAGAATAGQQVGDLGETSLDAAARLSAAELMRDAEGDRCRHAPTWRAAKRRRSGRASGVPGRERILLGPGLRAKRSTKEYAMNA